MSETRELAAILVSDVVGYRRLAGADEERTLARLRRVRSGLIDLAIAVVDAGRARANRRPGCAAEFDFRAPPPSSLPTMSGERRNMLRMTALTIGVSALVASTVLAQPTTVNVLDEYAHHPGTERLNTPSDEIEWLKKNQLNHGELDDFPQAAIILHRVEVERYLKELGFGGYYNSFSYGFTDPVLVFVVRKPGMTPFAVARGLPGAGGITTEAAELHAMGANTFVHVGTAGLLSPGVPWGQLVVSDGSYRDGAAFLLGDGANEQISRPDQSLTETLVETVSKDNVSHIRALGFTMPIYYFQPGSMLRALLGVTGPDAPMFIEMEEASLFASARLMGVRAASIVVASDRLENHDGRLSQEFWDGDLDRLELLAFEEAIHAIAGPIQH